MTVVVIGQRRYDTPHAIWTARYIMDKKPKAVALELPRDPFQEKLDKYKAGKLKDAKLKEFILDFVGKEIDLDEKLVQKFLENEIDAEELEDFEPDGSFFYILKAAKEVGADILAIDVPLHEIEEEVAEELTAIEQDHKDHLINKGKDIMVTKKVPSHVMGFAELIHKPFHWFEIVIGHEPADNPFHHPPHCRVCHWGVKYERFFHNFYAWFSERFHNEHEKRVFSVLHKFDKKREEKMAESIDKELTTLKKQDKEADMIVVMHLWHKDRVEGILRDEGVEIIDITI